MLATFTVVTNNEENRDQVFSVHFVLMANLSRKIPLITVNSNANSKQYAPDLGADSRTPHEV